MAILMVVVHHVEAHIHLLDRRLTTSFSDNWGTLGVDLFFVLSGFCLSLRPLREIEFSRASFDVAGYIVKRFVRIVPPFLAASFLALTLLLVARTIGVELDPSFHIPATFAELAAQLTFLDRSEQWLNPSFWSLAVEMRWYVLFPAALVLFVENERAFVTVIALLAFAFAFTGLWQSEDVAYLPCFMLGILAAGVAIRGRDVLRWSIPGIGAGASMGLLQRYLDPSTAIPTEFGWHVACFCFVCTVAASATLRKLFASRPLAAIGAASYGIYLVHEPIIGIGVRMAPAFARSSAAPMAFVMSSIVAGGVFYLTIERPLQRHHLMVKIRRISELRIATVLNVTGVPRFVRLRRGEPETAAAPAIRAIS